PVDHRIPGSVAAAALVHGGLAENPLERKPEAQGSRPGPGVQGVALPSITPEAPSAKSARAGEEAGKNAAPSRQRAAQAAGMSCASAQAVASTVGIRFEQHPACP